MPAQRTLPPFSTRQALIVAAVVIISSFGVGLTRVAWTAHSLNILVAEEQARVDALTQSIRAIDKELAFARTDEYVRTWARQTAKQTLAGETPIVLVVPNTAALVGPPSPTQGSVGRAAQAAPRPAEQAVPRWREFLNRVLGPSE